MRITIEARVSSKEEHDIELPIYGCHHLGESATHFSMERLDDGGLRRTSITEGPDGFTLSFSTYKPGEILDSSGPGYWLGKGDYASTKGHFRAAVEHFRDALPKVG